jgi:hypothetical protein
MQAQSHRRSVLLFALTALVAGSCLFQTAVTTQAAIGNSGSVASGNIYPPNDPPVASGFGVSVTVGSPVTGMLGSHVVDPENETMTFFVNSAAKGNVVANEVTGEFTYTPFAAAFGTDSFTYYAYDPQQNKSNEATVTVTINRPPTVANQSITVASGGVFNGQLQGSDLDGDTLTYAIAGQPTKGFVTLASNGAFTYVPNTGASGADSFTYTVNDGKSVSTVATVAVTIQQTPPVNQAPTAANQSITATVGVAFNGQLEGADLDGDALTYLIVSQPSKGNLTLGATGTFVYTPNAGVTGSDSFSYKVNDGKLDSNIAVVSITLVVTESQPVLDSTNGVTGASGSHFRLQASGFSPNSLLVITLNGHRVGTVRSNANGVAMFTMFFAANTKPGVYIVIVTENLSAQSIAAAAKSAQLNLTIDASAARLANPGGAPVINAQPTVYLPLAIKL